MNIRKDGFHLSPKAQEDLGRIWDYTAGRWGAAQAENYVRNIQHTIARLVAGDSPYQAIDDIRPGSKKALTGTHLLLFRIDDNGTIDIVRILHARMGIDQHL